MYLPAREPQHLERTEPAPGSLSPRDRHEEGVEQAPNVEHDEKPSQGGGKRSRVGVVVGFRLARRAILFFEVSPLELTFLFFVC